MKSFLPALYKQNKAKRETPLYKKKQAIWLAFFSGKLYVDVIKRWRGLGIFYFFIMLSIMIFPFSIQLIGKLNHLIEQELLLPIKRLPPLSVRDGAVVFHAPMPYLIKNDKGDVISIIDTEGHVNRLPVSDYPVASVLITKHAVHFDFKLLEHLHIAQDATENKIQPIVIPLDGYSDDDFLPSTWLDELHVPAFKRLLLASLYPMLTILNAVILMVILLSIALFAQLIARMAFKVKLSFIETSRLLFVAATPLACLCAVLALFRQVLPGNGLPYVILLALYFSFGVLAYKRSNKTLVVQ